jgi:predicted DNA-binding transcriptional regulator YafY
MPANKYALLRYRVIDRCLGNQARLFPSKEDLREACEEALYGSLGEHISASTIEKDLWAMRNESELGYYAPIAYSKAERGYYYEDSEYSINEISLNDEDLLAIRFAAKTLDQFRDIPIFRQYENAIDKIVNRIAISPLSEEGDLPFVQFETAPSSAEQGILQRLCAAISDQHQVLFSYQKFNLEQKNAYTLEPYLLKEYRNRWYLIGFNVQKGSMQTFGLDRMSLLEITKEKYVIQSNFNADTFFKHSIGITQLSAEPKKVVLDVSPTQAAYLKTQPIHPSQIIHETGTQWARIELFVLETYELTSFILGLGSQARVIEPSSLALRIQKELRDSLGAYS